MNPNKRPSNSNDSSPPKRGASEGIFQRPLALPPHPLRQANVPSQGTTPSQSIASSSGSSMLPTIPEDPLLLRSVKLGSKLVGLLADPQEWVDGTAEIFGARQIEARLQSTSAARGEEFRRVITNDSTNFGPISQVLQRLPIGNRVYTDLCDPRESTLRDARRMVNGLQPFPNLRIIYGRAEPSAGKESKGNEFHVSYDLICNPLDGVVVLCKSPSPTLGDPGLVPGGTTLASKEPAMTLCSVFSQIWRDCHSFVPKPTGKDKRQLGAWMWDYTQRVGTDPWDYTLRSMGESALVLNREFLNYVVVTSCDREEDLAIILRCVTGRPGFNGKMPEWHERLHTQSGRQTFQVGHWAFAALLGLPRCREFAETLILKKDYMGHKIIKSITVFQPVQADPKSGSHTADYGMTVWPALLLEIVPFDSKVMDGALAVRKTWSLEGRLRNIDCEPIASKIP